MSISTTNCLQQPIRWHNNHWMAQPPISGTSNPNDTAATNSLSRFPIHYTLIPRPTWHMLVALATCHKSPSVSISSSQRSHHSSPCMEESPLHPCTEESLHFTAKKYGWLFGIKVQSLSVQKAGQKGWSLIGKRVGEPILELSEWF